MHLFLTALEGETTFNFSLYNLVYNYGFCLAFALCHEDNEFLSGREGGTIGDSDVENRLTRNICELIMRAESGQKGTV